MEPLNKKIDKSEKERSTLTRKIIELEEKEDDFKLLQKRHENRVLYLAEQFEQLSSGVDSLLTESDMSTQFRIQELENNQELRRQMSEYVQIHFDDIEKLSQSFRRNTDEQRDKLISERNQLPWE
ncbi:cingulin [uncultured Streptococcus sp.]|uniref:cingulin n=1 Tax=uncultured Streptococcus sp. TaxID=83427 RepID=UPI00259B4885|nr:cingulin [uncultured Streptococcus sp.]